MIYCSHGLFVQLVCFFTFKISKASPILIYFFLCFCSCCWHSYQPINYSRYKVKERLIVDYYLFKPGIYTRFYISKFESFGYISSQLLDLQICGIVGLRDDKSHPILIGLGRLLLVFKFIEMGASLDGIKCSQKEFTNMTTRAHKIMEYLNEFV